ncbi:MAG: hypothetical protein JRM77_04780 [Nitrososphaerota archaeon]|nr:hypothetical protein [Nitrososphaerota archaeon]
MLTPFKLAASIAASTLIWVYLFFFTSGVLGPYGQPDDLYHFAIGLLLTTLVLAFLFSQVPGGTKK